MPLCDNLMQKCKKLAVKLELTFCKRVGLKVQTDFLNIQYGINFVESLKFPYYNVCLCLQNNF